MAGYFYILRIEIFVKKSLKRTFFTNIEISQSLPKNPMQPVPKITEVRSETVPIPVSGPEIIALDVGGMKCAGCAGAVERQLLQPLNVCRGLWMLLL
jgi:hypothetical protein